METQKLLTAGEALMPPPAPPEETPVVQLTGKESVEFAVALLEPPPPSAALMNAVERMTAVMEGPKPGDLFTTDRVSFYVVTNPEVLVAERANLVIHVPEGADWKTAVWEHISIEPGRATQVWDANGIPTPIGPAD